MTTLITFIGRGSTDVNGSGYRKTRYRFPDGELSTAVTYVGEALIDKLQPSKVVIVGTSGSIWDEICHQQIDESFYFQLLEKCLNHQVDATFLRALEHELNRQSTRQFSLVLVPDGASPQEQLEFLSIFTSSVDARSHVTLDITHGFRFMPILAFSAIQFLQFVKHVEVDDLLYAMYLPNQACSEIFTLKQNIELSRWVNAVSQYDHSGDLGVFVSLLREQGWDENAIKQLEKGAFLERTTNSSTARAALTNVLNQPVSTTIGKLMAPEFYHRTEWVRNTDRGDRECMLAHQYLARQDYLRAVIYGFEGLISTHSASDDYLNREETKPYLLTQYGEDFQLLRILRNNLVHGVKTDSANTMSKKKQEQYNLVNRVICDPHQLPRFITNLFKKLGI